MNNNNTSQVDMAGVFNDTVSNFSLNNPMRSEWPIRVIYHNMQTQFRFPRSRRKRIRIKWRNKQRNHRPDKQIRFAGGTYMIHISLKNDFEKMFKVIGYDLNIQTIKESNE